MDNIVLGYGGTKPLPKPILTYYQWCPVGLIYGQFSLEMLQLSITKICLNIMHLNICHISQVPMSLDSDIIGVFHILFATYIPDHFHQNIKKKNSVWKPVLSSVVLPLAVKPLCVFPFRQRQGLLLLKSSRSAEAEPSIFPAQWGCHPASAGTTRGQQWNIQPRI